MAAMGYHTEKMGLARERAWEDLWHAFGLRRYKSFDNFDALFDILKGEQDDS